MSIGKMNIDTPQMDSDSSANLHERKFLRKKSHDVQTPLISSCVHPKKDHNALIKYGSLLLLVGQMVGLVLLMRYTRTHSVNNQLYLASTAVFMMEISKFILCLIIIGFETGLKGLHKEIHRHTLGSPNEMMKLCVPSFLYTVQNNLLYLALTNLDAATYQILYQLKILTTAIFSKTMLGRQFSGIKWFSLVVLTAGVAVVQLSGSKDSSSSSQERNSTVGLVAVLCAACTSGFSGVYFEKILKGSDASVFVRNVQMGIPSMMIALGGVYMQDYEVVMTKGFFVGYNGWVWSVILVQAVGGLIVAVVVKYADNVLKVFASSFSIIFSCLISAVLFDFRPNGLFLVGAALVCLSTALYSKPEKKKRAVLPH
jgi:UDP-sugar transporter A1/2/3